jgi:hypothetical protein
MKKPFRHAPPAPPATQDAAWDRVVKALRSGTVVSDDDLPEGDDLPDDPEGHLAQPVGRR